MASNLNIPPQTWRRVLDVLERLAASSDLNEILGLVIDSLRDCLHADRASVFQFDPRTNELFAERAHGVDRSLRFSAEAGLAGLTIQSRAIVNVPDCYADPRFNQAIDRQTGYRTHSMLSVPLISFDGGPEGVAQVLNKTCTESKQHLPFDAADEVVARALASQAAIALRRARLIEAERQRNKYEADLATARLIQQSSLPDTIPSVENYDFAAQSRPAEETGGDSFDVLSIHTLAGFESRPGASGPDAQVLLFMADAAGHGIGPALSVTQVHAMLRMGARLSADIRTIVGHLNRQLARDLPAGRFVTAFIGLLSVREHMVRFIAAGQSPVLIVHPDGEAEEHMANFIPLGIDEDAPIPEPAVVRLQPGDVLAMLSDGYYEARPSEQSADLYGVHRVIELIQRGLARDHSLDDILQNLNDSVSEFLNGRNADDDQTAILVRRHP